MKISALAVELGSRHDFLVGSDAFFVNGLGVSSSLCALKISASGVELGFEDYFWYKRDAVFVNGFSVNSNLCA